MDSVATFSMFNQGSPIVMPSENVEEKAEETKSSLGDIREAILKKKVDKLIIPEGTDVPFKNYIFDLRALESWTIYEKNSLKTLVNKSGEVSLYIVTNKEGLRYFGNGKESHLDIVLPYIKDIVFRNKINIYKDFKADSKPLEINDVDKINFRLNL